MNKGFLLALLGFNLPALASPPPLKTENLVLVTLDGMRWQEVFGQTKSSLIDRTAVKLTPRYALVTAPQRQDLLPFLWNVVGVQGQLYGNRTYGNAVNVANWQHFSYPGYQEILTGYPDPRIRSNKPVNNPHPSVLEYVSLLPAYQGRIAAFASWEVIRNILNEPCCDFPVNAGWQPAAGPELTNRERQLNATLQTCARTFRQERPDTLTCAYALEYLKRRQPRVLFLSLGDTDEQAHADHYGAYLQAAHTADDCLARLWAYLQATPQYRNKTTLLITTDHGRGRGPWWRSHGLQVPGAGQTWLAVLGPDTPATGEQRRRQQLQQSQVAQTLALLLRVPYAPAHKTGRAVRSVLVTN